MKDRASTLTRLAADHAYWADQVRVLKKLGEASAAACTRSQPPKDCSPAERIQALNADDCIKSAFIAFEDNLNEYGYSDASSFEEIWDELVSDNEVCLPCQHVRKYKAERMAARKRLGSIRAAITRMGRAINKDNQHE